MFCLSVRSFPGNGPVAPSKRRIAGIHLGVKGPVGHIDTLKPVLLIQMLQLAGGQPTSLEPLTEQFSHSVFIHLKRQHSVRNHRVCFPIRQYIIRSAKWTFCRSAGSVHLNPGAAAPALHRVRRLFTGPNCLHGMLRKAVLHQAALIPGYGDYLITVRAFQTLCGHVELHDSAAALTVIDFFFHALQPHLCLQRRQLIVYG